jgi:endonuclease/exonuclease/phosphatase (EEP) superfamily protein YafD
VIVSAAIILAVFLTVPAFARATAGRSRASTTVAAFAPVAAVLAALATILAAIFLGWPAIVPAVPTVLLLAWQVPRRRPRCSRRAEDPRSVSRSVELRTLSLNALVGGASAAALTAEVARLAPDVLAVQELTPDLVGQLTDAGLDDLLPYSELDPSPGARGIGIWSRWPLARRSAVADTRRLMPRLELDAGIPLTITLVHPVAPVGGAARQRAWRHDLGRLLSSLSEVVGHHLLIGDFNATRDMREFRQLLAAQFADCADAAAVRQWPGFTWPANHWLPPLLRLDHILISVDGAFVRQSSTIRVPGTDHLGVFAVVELRPRALPNSGPAEGGARTP